ncbi:MAG: hypothetical protein ACKN9E_06295 [Microcystaceae cyanobacterium]
MARPIPYVFLLTLPRADCVRLSTLRGQPWESPWSNSSTIQNPPAMASRRSPLWA